jgi:hypothetical protein
MAAYYNEGAMTDPRTVLKNSWCILFVLLGAVALVLKHSYHGPFDQLVHSYGGNIVASFALFFLSAFAVSGFGLGRLIAAGAALAVVEAFEITDGFFGVMSNTYDPFDLIANAVGIGVALSVDFAVRRMAGKMAGNRGPGR